MKKSIIGPCIVTSLLLFILLTASQGVANGAKSALHTCGTIIIPCLLPFFTVSYLIGALGLPVYLGQALHKPMAILFGTSGTGASIFILSILGGYPLGAAVIADHVKRGDISTEDANKLLRFCNNSGPAFLIGAAGIGIFHSSPIGVFLYGIHILSAVITGLFLSDTHLPSEAPCPILISSTNLSESLTQSITKATVQLLYICGYIVCFGAVIGALEEYGFFPSVYGTLSQFTCLPLSLTKALCMGVLELSCGIGALSGVPLTPQSLTVCSFLIGFGSISVCLQTAAVLADSGIQLRNHILGRICCGGISAFLTFTISSVML